MHALHALHALHMQPQRNRIDPIMEKLHKISFRHVLDDLDLKIIFVGQPWWLACFMLHLPRNLGPHLYNVVKVYLKVNSRFSQI